MRELYAITHDYWTLPVTADYPDDQDQFALVRVGAGIPMLQIQREVIGKLLDTLGSRKTPTRWVIPKENLEAYGELFTGNPESVVDWRPITTRVHVNTDTQMNHVDNEFFVEFVKKGFVKNTAVAKVLWKAYCQHCLHWMINKRGTVDLLFCKLTPLPYRPNWKSFLLNEWLKSNKKKSVKPPVFEQDVKKWIKAASTPMLSPSILWFNKKERYIYWSIEVKAGSLWYRMVAAKEAARKHRLTMTYFSSIVNDLKSVIPEATKIYAAFLREISRPGFQYRSASEHNLKGGSNREPQVPIPPIPINHTPVSIAPGYRKERPGEFLSEAEEKAFLSGMPDLQPPVQNMRDSG